VAEALAGKLRSAEAMRDKESAEKMAKFKQQQRGEYWTTCYFFCKFIHFFIFVSAASSRCYPYISVTTSIVFRN
jgi:hypothetical protein